MKLFQTKEMKTLTLICLISVFIALGKDVSCKELNVTQSIGTIFDLRKLNFDEIYELDRYLHRLIYRKYKSKDHRREARNLDEYNKGFIKITKEPLMIRLKENIKNWIRKPKHTRNKVNNELDMNLSQIDFIKRYM
jgi:hypothetical protein